MSNVKIKASSRLGLHGCRIEVTDKNMMVIHVRTLLTTKKYYKRVSPKCTSVSIRRLKGKAFKITTLIGHKVLSSYIVIVGTETTVEKI